MGESRCNLADVLALTGLRLEGSCPILIANPCGDLFAALIKGSLCAALPLPFR